MSFPDLAAAQAPFKSLRPRQSYILLGPFQSPGVCTIRGHGSPRKWAVPEAYGWSWSSLRYLGKVPARFEVDIDLWLPSHHLEWKIFATILAPPVNGIGPAALSPTGGALGISHPRLSGPPLNITTVVVEDVLGPVQSDTGKETYTIKFIEWRKPLPALARPIAAIPAAPATAVQPPDENEKIMGQLTAQIAKLGG